MHTQTGRQRRKHGHDRAQQCLTSAVRNHHLRHLSQTSFVQLLRCVPLQPTLQAAAATEELKKQNSQVADLYLIPATPSRYHWKWHG